MYAFFSESYEPECIDTAVCFSNVVVWGEKVFLKFLIAIDLKIMAIWEWSYKRAEGRIRFICWYCLCILLQYYILWHWCCFHASCLVVQHHMGIEKGEHSSMWWKKMSNCWPLPWCTYLYWKISFQIHRKKVSFVFCFFFLFHSFKGRLLQCYWPT